MLKCFTEYLLLRKRLLRAIIGLVLVFSGIVIILSNLNIIRSVDFLWYVFFVLFGVYLFYIGFKKQVIFEGIIASFLLPIGISGLMWEFEMIPYGISALWPTTLLMFAIYLIIHYVAVRRNWLLYISSMLFLFGTIFLLRNVGLLAFSLRQILFKLWPLVLVFIGFYLLKGLIEKNERKNL